MRRAIGAGLDAVDGGVGFHLFAESVYSTNKARPDEFQVTLTKNEIPRGFNLTNETDDAMAMDSRGVELDQSVYRMLRDSVLADVTWLRILLLEERTPRSGGEVLSDGTQVTVWNEKPRQAARRFGRNWATVVTDSAGPPESDYLSGFDGPFWNYVDEHRAELEELGRRHYGSTRRRLFPR